MFICLIFSEIEITYLQILLITRVDLKHKFYQYFEISKHWIVILIGVEDILKLFNLVVEVNIYIFRVNTRNSTVGINVVSLYYPPCTSEKMPTGHVKSNSYYKSGFCCFFNLPLFTCDFVKDTIFCSWNNIVVKSHPIANVVTFL